MPTYPRTDVDVLNVRPCPDCGYDIHPGYEHGRQPQPAGGSHVVCSLQPVRVLRQWGPCKTCGVACGAWHVDGLGVVLREHYGPVADDHDAEPGSLRLAEMVSSYLDHVHPDANG